MGIELIKEDIETKISELEKIKEQKSIEYQREMREIFEEICELNESYKQIEGFFGSDTVDPKEILKLNIPTVQSINSVDQYDLMEYYYMKYNIDLVRDVYYSLIQLYGYQDKLISTDISYLRVNYRDVDRYLLSLYYYWIRGSKDNLEQLKEIAGDDFEGKVHLFLKEDKSLFGSKYRLNRSKNSELSAVNKSDDWISYSFYDVSYNLNKRRLYDDTILIDPKNHDEMIDMEDSSFEYACEKIVLDMNYSKITSIDTDFLRDFLYRMMLYCRNNDIKGPMNRVQMEEFYKAMYGEELMRDPSRVDKRKLKIHIGR